MMTPKGNLPLFFSSIKNRILVFVVMFEVAAYGTIQLFNNVVYNNELSQLKNSEIQQTFAASVEKINKISQLMERNVSDLAAFGEHLYQLKNTGLLSMTQLAKQSEKLLVTNFSGFPEAIGGGIWYEPYSLDQKTQFFGPYAFQDKGKVVFSWDLNTPEYNYPKQDWYTIANVGQTNKIAGKERPIFWTEPYYDEAGSFSLMMTVDALMFNDNGQGVGMATVDWSLLELTSALDKVKISKNAYPFFIYQGAGAFLSYPKDPKMVLKSASKFDWGQEVLNNANQNRLLSLYDVNIDDESYNIYYFRTNRGFIFGSLVPVADLQQSISAITTITLLAGLAIGLVFIVLMILLMRRLFTPFDKVLALIKGSIHHQKHDNTVVIERIDYPQNNEFTPLIKALGDIYQQVSTYLQQISESKNEIESLNAELEQKVDLRTMQLEKKTTEAIEALEQLKVTQQQLIENEKHVAQGRLVAGVAHKINTPLGISVTAASCISIQLNEAFDGMLGGKLKRSQLQERYEELNEGCLILNDNLSRAADLIHSFKQLAVNPSSLEFRQFGLALYIKNVLQSLESKINASQHEVVLSCDEQLEIYSQPSGFAHVLSHLIDNALTHGLVDHTQGVVDISVEKSGEDIKVTIADNGQGMTEALRASIFEPFTATNQHQEGSGLGMHLILTLVTQTLNGTITCQSEVSQGTTFVIILPGGH